MAVEARHRNSFPTQFLSNREFMMNGVESKGNTFGVVTPLLRTSTETDVLIPMYGSAIDSYIPAKTAVMQADSGVTYLPISRKRSREASDSLLSSYAMPVQNQNSINSCSSFAFLGEDISFQIQQQQMEMNRYIAQHIERVRMEIDERRKRHSRRIAAAVEENVMKKLKAKEEEIEKIGKLNCALEERVKSLCFENQIWRDLARTNEATANALRCNLEQVLTQVQEQQQQRHRSVETAVDLADDAESCCGSNMEETDRRVLTESGASSDGCNVNVNDGAASNRMCRSCEKEESCVLLLPCRHLCLCTCCGSTLHTCPVCNSAKTASVHVNLFS